MTHERPWWGRGVYYVAQMGRVGTMMDLFMEPVILVRACVRTWSQKERAARKDGPAQMWPHTFRVARLRCPASSVAR